MDAGPASSPADLIADLETDVISTQSTNTGTLRHEAWHHTTALSFRCRACMQALNNKQLLM
jgi:hypothetical protein